LVTGRAASSAALRRGFTVSNMLPIVEATGRRATRAEAEGRGAHAGALLRPPPRLSQGSSRSGCRRNASCCRIVTAIATRSDASTVRQTPRRPIRSTTHAHRWFCKLARAQPCRQQVAARPQASARHLGHGPQRGVMPVALQALLATAKVDFATSVKYR
jgi:hypothetical protein